MSMFVILLFLSPLLRAVPVDNTKAATPEGNEDVIWESVFLTTTVYTTVTTRSDVSASTKCDTSIEAAWSTSMGSGSEETVTNLMRDEVSGSINFPISSLQWTSPSQAPPDSQSVYISLSPILSSNSLVSTDPISHSPISTPTISPEPPLQNKISYSAAPEASASLSVAACQQIPRRLSRFMGQSHSKVSNSESKKESWRNTLKDNLKETLTSFGVGDAPNPSQVPVDNIFVPIKKDTDILSQIDINCSHPAPRTGILDDDSQTLHTNKFYANAFLGQQNQPIWTHPYYIWWGKGAKQNGQIQTWGMNVGHTEIQDLLYFGKGTPVQAYINPCQQSLVLSAKELDAGLDPAATLTTDTHLPFSVNINLNTASAPNERKITFPVVQGMSFVTAKYNNARPMIQTGGDGFKEVLGSGKVGGSAKYLAKGKDGRSWVIYVTPLPGLKYDPVAFVRTNNNTLLGPSGFSGTIQVAKNPLGTEGEALYDKAAGTYVTGATITGTVNDTKGTYSLNYNKVGNSTLLMFGLPHHIQSLDPEIADNVTKLQLRTTTKGNATAIFADTMTFVEPQLPTGMGFGPWNPTSTTSKLHYPTSFLNFLAGIAERDLSRAMNETIPQDSMYYAGKSLAKLATLVWVIHDILNNTALATKGLNELKSEMQRYVENRQQFRLNYDYTWKGIVSTAGYADAGADFGNTYYNDHHFHFGYFVYTSAVIGSLDPEWLNQGDNKEWTNMLVKDFAESDYNGRDYPFSRAFDWYVGHSWAKGLFESADGKDEESTSEDGFASYAIKMWGKTIGDANMEKRGALMLAIQSRSFNNYFYLTSTNTNHPPNFIPNKVTGILFENKVDYTTYFGALPQYIHGIHMLPVSPPSTYLRPKNFVQEEWDAFFANDKAALVDGGWRGVLYANLALIDPKASFAFFRNGVDGFWDDAWIDGGASRTWYLVLAAGLGGASR